MLKELFCSSITKDIRSIKRDIWVIKNLLKLEGGDIMAKFDALIQEVAENRNAIESAKLAFIALRQAIIDAEGDPAELQAIVDGLSAQTDELASAVAENTPVVG